MGQSKVSRQSQINVQSKQDNKSKQDNQINVQSKQDNESGETGIKVRMGSRAVQHFHRRNPSQHRVLASIIDDMNKETRMKNLKMHKSGARITNDIEPMEGEQENLEDSRRMGRPEKKVTWSRNLLQVRSISPRQKSPRTPKMAESIARTSRMSEAVNTLRGGPLTQEGAGVKDCGHFLCQRVGGVCLQGAGGDQQQGGGGNLRPGYQASNSTGYQASNTGYQATQGYPNLPCSPQMPTVVWRSIPISRASNNNNGKRAGLTLDLGNAFLQGEALI